MGGAPRLAGPAARRQVHQPGGGGAAGRALPLRPRGQGGGLAAEPQHRPDPRLRHRQRRPLSGHGAARRRGPGGAPRDARAAARRRHGEPGPAGGAGAAPAGGGGHRPPGPQAEQPLHHPRRRGRGGGQGPRLRHRQGPPPGDGRRHAERRHDRLAALHEPRAGAGQPPRGSPQRSLVAGGHRLSRDHRPHALPGGRRRRPDDQRLQRRAAPPRRSTTRSAPRSTPSSSRRSPAARTTASRARATWSPRSSWPRERRCPPAPPRSRPSRAAPCRRASSRFRPPRPSRAPSR